MSLRRIYLRSTADCGEVAGTFTPVALAEDTDTVDGFTVTVNWQWLSLTLAAPVVISEAWPFHKAAWANLRHGAATMDTLISVGTLAALAWSVYALLSSAAPASPA